jgi:hypothetical protein
VLKCNVNGNPLPNLKLYCNNHTYKEASNGSLEKTIQLTRIHNGRSWHCNASSTDKLLQYNVISSEAVFNVTCKFIDF